MKTITTILTVFSFLLLYSFADAQNGCSGTQVKVYKGATGCGCHCMKECVTLVELPLYLLNGWNTEGCWNCCKFKNWVEAGSPKTSLDSIYQNVDLGSLTVAFTLASERDVRIQVADLTGRHVATVTDAYREDQDNELIWDKSQLSPGIYYITLEAGDHRETKMVSVTE